MFKLLQNILSSEASEASQPRSEIANSDVSSWEAQIAQADVLWGEGKITEALEIYGVAIEKNPNLPDIQRRLAGRIKQQGELATAYERLATGLKNQGKIEQAANYYRQAISIKALTGDTKNQLLRSSIVPLKKTPIPIANLKEAAFSFQPLTNNSAIVKVANPLSTSPNVQADLDTSPQFYPRIKAVNPQQAQEIDWETAQVYFQKALEHLEKQEWSQSALACKQATQIKPDMAEAYKIWGNALQRMGKTGEAMACYAKAVEIKPNLAEVYAGIADIYAQQSQWKQAIKHYQKAIIIKPSAKIYRKLATIWRQIGDTEKAEFNLYQATELELAENSKTQTELELELGSVDHNNLKKSVTAYSRAAQQLGQKNQWKQAAKYYRQALDLSMSRPALAAASSSNLQPNEARATVKKQNVINQNTTSPGENISQLDRAIRRYHKQAKLQPNSPKIYTDLGNLYRRKSKLSEAITCYRQAIKLNRKYPQAHLNLARVFWQTGKQQEFIKEMQLALALEPKIGTAMDRFSLGNALVEQNQEQQAISCYYKAIVLQPKFSAAYHRLSDILSKRGKQDQAIKFLEQSIKQNPQAPEAYYFLAQQWEQLENWEMAVKTYSHVLRLEPKYPEASKKLNYVLAQKLRQSRLAKQESTMPIRQ